LRISFYGGSKINAELAKKLIMKICILKSWEELMICVMEIKVETKIENENLIERNCNFILETIFNPNSTLSNIVLALNHNATTSHSQHFPLR
jgi:hypothetical protein